MRFIAMIPIKKAFLGVEDYSQANVTDHLEQIVFIE